MVNHLKRLARNLRFEKKKPFISEFITLPQGLYSPHRTFQLELIVLNWTKRPKSYAAFGILLLFAIVFLYITYLNGNRFAVAPSASINRIKKCFYAFLSNHEFEK